MANETINNTSAPSDQKSNDAPKPLLSDKKTFDRIAYGLGAAAMVFLLLIPVIYFIKKDVNLPKPSLLRYEEGIGRLSDKAFGDLSLGAGSVSGSAANDAMLPARSSATAMGGGGIAAPMGMESKMIAPAQFDYSFKYKGDEITLEDDKLDVYKRTINKENAKALARYLGDYRLNTLDLSRFQDSSLTNFNIVEDREFGYQISIDLLNDSASIYSNWTKWPQLFADCLDEDCYARNRIKPGDMPGNDQLIAIAGSFLSTYGIKMDSYGEPVVQDYWRTEYEAATDKASVYLPEDIGIIYPLKIKGMDVYDEGGNPAGLYVSVNIRQKRVSGVSSIIGMNFEASSYPAITESAKVVESAENGGSNWLYRYGGNGEKKEVLLGTPKRGLLRHFAYDNDSQETRELYIPALVFPVEKSEESNSNIYMRAVVVPLIEGLIEERGDIMPMFAPGEARSGSGAADSNAVQTEIINKSIIKKQ